ncbi:MAG: hypothetical protein SGI88_11710 [Candidatus Hydrogenedentes bacterium]|nr:hypothetical protein [Candidatus Hydrogenedentota bacterium]
MLEGNILGGHEARTSDGARQTVIVILLITALVGFWFNYVLFERPPLLNDAAGDILRIHLPNVFYSVETLKTGALPLWNPNEFCGMPMFAGLEFGPLYPPNWTFLFLPLDIGHLLGALLHQVLLSVGTFLFLRHALRISIGGAAFGALCIAFSGWSTFRMLTEFDAYRSSAYIPLILLFSDRVIARVTPARCVALAVAVALQLLAGETEVWVRTLMLVAAYSAYRLLQLLRNTGPRAVTLLPVIGLFAAVLLAVGIVAVQLLPALEASWLSLRSTSGLTFDHAFRGGIEDAPTLLSMMTVYSYPAHGQFIGFLPIVIAAYALTRHRGDVLFFLALATVSFALILGDNTFVAKFYYALPTGNWFRAPIRFLPYLVFAVAALAGIGAHQFIEDLFRPTGKRRWFAMTAVLVLVAPLLSPIASSKVEFTSAAIGAILLAVVVIVAVRSKVEVWGGVAAFTVLCISYLALPATLYDLREFNIPRPLDFVGPAAEALPALRQGLKPGERVYVDYAFETGRRQPKFGTLTGIPAINGISAFMPRSFWDFIYPYSSTRIRAMHEQAGYGGMSAQSGLWGGLAVEHGALQALNVLGVRRIGLGLGNEFADGDQDAPPALRAIYDNGDAPLFDRFAAYDNPAAWPRAFVVDAATVDSIDSLLHHVEVGMTAATIKEYGANDVQIGLPGESGLLILTDQVYPGWQARVDGKATPILPVAGIFRGVRVDADDEVIEFYYRPKSLVYGSAISAVAIAIASVFLLWHRIRGLTFSR